MAIENCELKIFSYSSVHLFDYISLGLLIDSDLNLVALTSQPLPFHSTAHVLCLDSPQLTGGSVADKSTRQLLTHKYHVQLNGPFNQLNNNQLIVLSGSFHLNFIRQRHHYRFRPSLLYFLCFIVLIFSLPKPQFCSWGPHNR